MTAVGPLTSGFSTTGGGCHGCFLSGKSALDAALPPLPAPAGLLGCGPGAGHAGWVGLGVGAAEPDVGPGAGRLVWFTRAVEMLPARESC